MWQRIGFNEIEEKVPATPGIYEVYTLAGTPLKVGIGQNLRRRLLQHRVSRQSCLKLKPGGHWSCPSDVKSKQSILAKHLYYDQSITDGYSLTTEEGRQRFLEEQCYIHFMTTSDKEEACKLEKHREASVSFRYFGKVKHL